MAINDIRFSKEIGQDPKLLFSLPAREDYYKNLSEKLQRRNEDTDVVTPKWLTSQEPLDFIRQNISEEEIKIKKDLGNSYLTVRNVEENINGLQSETKKLQFEAVRPDDIQKLETAVEAGDIKFVDSFIRDRTRSDPVYALHLACYFNQPRIVEELLAAGVDVQGVSAGQSPLLVASWKGCVKIVKMLLKHGALAEAKDMVFGYTPLHVACSQGHEKIVRLLIHKGADVNASDNKKCSPLHMACTVDKTSVVKFLLQKNADVNSRSNTQSTPLHFACFSKLWEIVDLLIEYKADIHAKDVRDSTPLHCACWTGSKEVVESLVRNNVNTEAVDLLGYTPLLVACHVVYSRKFLVGTGLCESFIYTESHTDIIVLLVRKGSNVNVQDKAGNTPLHLSSLVGNKKLVETFVQKKAGVDTEDIFKRTPLHAACCQPNASVVEILLLNGASVNAQDNSLRTPLMYASNSGHADIVKRLVEQNAGVNATCRDGFTPLHYACLNGHSEVAKVLISHKAETDGSSAEGLTLLHCACLNGNKELIRMLLGVGQIVDAEDSIGRTPLCIASWSGNAEATEILLQHDASVNLATKNGVTPLWVASLNGRLEIVELLLKYKANANFKTRAAQTPLHAAGIGGHADVARLLLTNGAEMSVNGKDAYELTPLHYASFYRHEDVLNVLVRHHADVDQKASLGVTALNVACYRDDVDIVKVLLSHGADVNVRAPDGVTPLHCAVSQSRVHVIKTLLADKADVNATDIHGVSALHYACLTGCGEVVDTLLQRGPDVNAKTKLLDTTPLLVACHRNLPDIALKLLEGGADLESEDADGRTALHAASMTGSIEMVKLLVSRGARTDHRDKRGWTALHLACQRDSQDVFNFLIQKFDNVDESTADDVSPLQIASAHGHDSAVESLIRKGANLAFKDKHGRTALHFACYNGKIKVVEILLKEKVGLDEPDSMGWCPLHLSCQKGHANIVKALITNKANVSLKTNEGLTPLHVASSIGVCDVAEILLENCAKTEATEVKGNTSLHVACFNGFEELVTLLIERGSDVDATNRDGYTPLHAACSGGHYNIVDCLITKHAKTDISAQKGETPIHFACFSGNERIVQRLFMAKVNVNVGDIQGATPMHWACLLGHVKIMTLLIQYGSYVDAKTKAGHTPLFAACDKGFTEIVRRLCLDYNVRVDVADVDGRTPLLFASFWGHIEIVEILLSRSKSEIKVKDKWGRTPLHRASANGHTEVVKLLLRNGAEIDAPDVGRWTPLHLVCQTDHVDIAVLLLQNGARADRTTCEGYTPLDIAICHQKENMKRVLLENVSGSFSQTKKVNVEDRDCHQSPNTMHTAEGKKLITSATKQDTEAKQSEDKTGKKQDGESETREQPSFKNAAQSENPQLETEERPFESKVFPEHGVTLTYGQEHCEKHEKDNGNHCSNRNRDTPDEGDTVISSFGTSEISSEQTQCPSYPPIFSPHWEVAESFSSTGGTLQKRNSDVVLHVPESCVRADEWIDVKSAICADAMHVHRVLRHALNYRREDWLASPVAEYSCSHSFSVLKGPFVISLPHCLPRDPDPDRIHVYCVLRHGDGHLTLRRVRPDEKNTVSKLPVDAIAGRKPEAKQPGTDVVFEEAASADLPNQWDEALLSQDPTDRPSGAAGGEAEDSPSREPSGAEGTVHIRTKVGASLQVEVSQSCPEAEDGVEWDPSATFRLLPDGKIFITTDHFSAYLCMYCRTGQPPPQLNAMAYGSHTERRDGRRAARVMVVVWDDRLKIADFRQTFGVREEDDRLEREELYLSDAFQDSDLQMSFEILEEDGQTWQHRSRNNGQLISAITECFHLNKYYLSWCEDCEGKRKKEFGDLRPIKKTWHLENRPNSTPGSHLDCLVELKQLSKNNADHNDDNIIQPNSVQMFLNLTLPQKETEDVCNQLRQMKVEHLEALANERGLICKPEMQRLQKRWHRPEDYKDQLVCRISDSHKLLPAALSALSRQNISPVDRQSGISGTLEPLALTRTNEEGNGMDFIDFIENTSTSESDCSESSGDIDHN